MTFQFINLILRRLCKSKLRGVQSVITTPITVRLIMEYVNRRMHIITITISVKKISNWGQRMQTGMVKTNSRVRYFYVCS